MAESKVVVNGGVGIYSLLALIFITLKLTKTGVVATWSWLWVLSPLWIPFVLGMTIIGGILLFAFLEYRRDKKKQNEIG